MKSIVAVPPLLVLAFVATLATPAVAQQKADFPQFRVPGHDAPMQQLQEMFRLHHGGAYTDCTLWDAWLPHATLWAGVGEQPSAAAMRGKYRGAFLQRRIDGEGYVSMQQHRGMAHSEGWPFPGWQQSTGMGWHFSVEGDVWAVQNFAQKALTSAEGWKIEGAEVSGIDPARGLQLRLTTDRATIVTPKFACGTIVAPFARLDWAAANLPAGAKAFIEWRLQDEKDWAPSRRVEIALPTAELQYTNVPLYRQPGYAGVVAQYRLTIEGGKSEQATGATLSLKSLITAIDTRHPITNSNFVRGSAEYFAWTGDREFLQQNIGRMRRALRFAISEFQVREKKLVHVPWVGHDGRSGLAFNRAGRKQLRPGLGVGNNYWDLMPFGGDDALATIYLLDALNWMADLEAAIAQHPEWKIAAAPAADAAQADAPFDAADLRQLADAVRDNAQRVFWNEETGRFVGWRDLDGKRYDYGFTFLNTEAIYYGLASPDQARTIYAWLDGTRTVAGDTSQGADIYHWRFGPRSTTLRNTRDYVWAWSAPESIPWGNQVQDGGGVLGFSYFDLMARLKTLGPDDAWRRLQTMLVWFGEVQSEGGYRKYYAMPGRGTLQGGGPPGGLGFDNEFLESVLVPQVVLYGFLGCEARPEGLRLQPQLPNDWPELTVTNIAYRDHLLDITAKRDELRITPRTVGSEPIVLHPEPGRWQMSKQGVDGKAIGGPVAIEIDASHPATLQPAVGETIVLKRLATPERQ